MSDITITNSNVCASARKRPFTIQGAIDERSQDKITVWGRKVSLLLAVALHYYGLFDLAFVAQNWGSFVCLFNIYGLLLALVFYIKAHVSPTHPEDRKFSGSIFYDFYMGIEFNPRLGADWDMKLFHNGRPGMIGCDMCFAAWQYKQHGYITNSMIITSFLHAVYVIDFFCNEGWYLKTLDMCHDHFGFYFSWGIAAWLPVMYTLQTQYLATHPVDLSSWTAALILTTGVSGYVLFRAANHQKYISRATNGDCKIWGKPPQFIRAKYKTAEGSMHESLLLCSGWWGLVRHANYLGDLILSYSMCASCGFTNLLPWTYAIYMTILLVHRCYRDEVRCHNKYGDSWKEYCAKVPYRIIPGIF
ncbi:TPA_exp: hypothetical protein A8136_4488 [Trichophyton benhamiae CBS 112371]|nr:TPA_exp: hypothetical protein A8136_4488 [Trichophyton benhamiae CBS 112371]